MRIVLVILLALVVLAGGVWWIVAKQSRHQTPVGMIASDRQARLYEWRRVDQTPLAELTPVMQQWRERGGESMVVDLTVFAPAAATNSTEAVITALAAYVTTAQTIGLQVEALAGDLDLLNSPQEIQQIYAGINQFNRANPQLAIKAIVWDVEPWQKLDWDPVAFLNFVDATNASAPRGLIPGYAVPAWFAGEKAQQVMWRGQQRSMAQALAGLVGSSDGSFIAVMDYFDTVAEAQQGFAPWLELGVPVRSIFEIGNSEPGTTLLGQSWEQQAQFFNDVSAPWLNNPVYRGVDVDSAGFLPAWQPPQ